MMRPAMRNSLLLAAFTWAAPLAAGEVLDFTRAVVVFPDGSTGPEKKALAMLLDRVEKRSEVRLEARSKRSERSPRPPASLIPASRIPPSAPG